MLRPFGVLLIVGTLGLAACGGTGSEPAEEASPPAAEASPPETEATRTEQEAPPTEEEGSPCARMAVNVEDYDVLAPGASRAGYLTLLHRFQRDCPDEAREAGLVGEGLPQCEDLAQENCTMHPEAASASPPPAKRFGLTVSERKEIFAAVVRYQDTHPGQDEEADSVIAKEWGITVATVNKIIVEGIEEGWQFPPSP